MDGDLEVGVLKIQGDHPISLADRSHYSPDCLHLEFGGGDKPVEGREVDDRAEAPCDLRDNEQMAVKARRRRSLLDGTLG